MKYRVKFEALGHSSEHEVEAENKIEAMDKAWRDLLKDGDVKMSIPLITVKEMP